MLVYRICGEWEVINILCNGSFGNFGSYGSTYGSNNHKYDKTSRYLHFFRVKTSVIYHTFYIGRLVATYDIPDDVLEKCRGVGEYTDVFDESKKVYLEEFAVRTSELRTEYLKKVESLVSTDYAHNLDNFDSLLALFYEDPVFASRQRKRKKTLPSYCYYCPSSSQRQ